MKAKDLMVDIEALGSVVTQIGACTFDRDTGEVFETFLENLTVAPQLDAGLEIHLGAVNFWLNEAKAGSELTWRDNQHHPAQVLQWLNIFVGGATEDTGLRGVWSHATYDMPQLARLYRTFNINRGWKFRKERDIRTLVDLSRVSLKEVEHKHDKSHDALEDCLYQVEYCAAAFKELNKKG